LGYSLYDTIIVFDRVRENVPRMPRAAFSQIVNRSMSEVLTRSLATTSCTLLPIVALLLFGGSTLQDFAFALLIGVASGAYSSIFIASPVLTHWKEREAVYRSRRARIENEFGYVPAYAAGAGAADVDPEARKPRRVGRLTTPEPDSVSAAEFEQMKRDLEIEPPATGRGASTLTKRLAHRDEPEVAAPARPAAPDRPAPDRPAPAHPAPAHPAPAHPAPARPAPARATKSSSSDVPSTPPSASTGDQPPAPAPDVAENDGVAQTPKPQGASKSRSRNRRHGRRR
ncbi:MAG TPA: hypothetical protein VLP43_10245, partial [Solirubrobacteraceae bacterium]|nr:hypothetical protein [Solirubrobacteraceae bacterium]